MITDILKFHFLKNSFEYRGTLRNERRFNMDDKVFFSRNKYDTEIFWGTIVGVEKTISDNPDYIYKIRLSENIATDSSGNVFSNIQCDSIFNNITEAKESAVKSLEHRYKLQKEEIDRYFEQFQ